MSLVLLGASGLHAADAQTMSRDATPQQQQRPTLIAPEERPLPPVAREAELYCAGFIEQETAPIRFEVVGGEQEQEQRIFAEGDYVFISGGAQQGVTAGQEFSVVRPRGRFNSRLTAKRGALGIFTQEVGRLRVTQVKANSSVAFVVKSCEQILHGDVLRAVQQPANFDARLLATLAAHAATPPDRFADPNGKQQGRIVMARDLREMVTRDQIVYVDLGREDNVKPGDLLTIFRPAGTGNITRFRGEEITPNKVRGFESERFRGGTFSNKAQRAKDPNGTGFNDQDPTNTPEVRKRRPAVPRKILGEAVVLSVEARTATVIIKTVTLEIHTGDFVELQ